MSRYDAQHPLFGCRLKLRRANEHLLNLNRAIEGFLERNPYVIVDKFDPETGDYLLWVRVRENTPLEWSTLIGDIVHNFRTALDHLAWQLVKKGGGNPSGDTAFPIFSKDPFASKDKRPRERFRKSTKGMHPDDITLIKELQPYQRPEGLDTDLLYQLSRLSNWDKHRELHLAGQSLEGTTFRINQARDCSVGLKYSRPFGAFVHGTVVAQFGVVRTGPNPEVDMDIHAALGVAFAEGGPAAGMSVRQMLIETSNYVTDVVNKFDELRFS